MDQYELWDRIATSFDATRQRPWPHVVAFLAALPARQRVLDLMCGNGRHLVPARALGHACVGADWSRPLVERAGGRAVVADATRLPFPAATFDACTYVAGLHGLPAAADRHASLQEMRRVLRPGAKAQVTVWSRTAPRFADLGLPSGPADAVVPWRRDGHDAPRTYHLHTPDSLRNALEAAGLEVRTLDEVAIASPEADNLVAVVQR